jgi:hypothetical protein
MEVVGIEARAEVKVVLLDNRLVLGLLPHTKSVASLMMTYQSSRRI